MGNIATHNAKIKAEASRLLLHPQSDRLCPKLRAELRRVERKVGGFLAIDGHVVNIARERLIETGAVA